MSVGGSARGERRSPPWLTPVVALGLGAASVVLLLSLTSPELSWDEADLVASGSRSWWSLWSRADYPRHFHGPMGIYLAKIGRELVPSAFGSIEMRTRLPTALVASSAVGLLYWMLRRVFETSRAAALVGSSLLLFSFIRLEETNVIGPHHLILVGVFALLGLGYHFRDAPGRRTALVLGLVLGVSAVTMTYVIPAGLCVAAALALSRSQWLGLGLNPPNIRISRWVFVALGTAALVLLVVWPPGIVKLRLIRDFGAFVVMGHHPSLVGTRMFEVTPRWAALYWLLNGDAPLVAVAAGVIVTAFWRAFRTRRVTSRHVYVGVCVAFFVGTALTAHLAGARNLLQVVGVLCLATGALFDDAFGRRSQLIRFAAPAIVVLAAVNLARVSRSSTYAPFLATDGYRAFVAQGEGRLREKAGAIVYGLPVLYFYSQEAGLSPAWEASEIWWTTQSFPLSDDVKYVLIPAFIYEHMPAAHPMRRIVADHWKVAWSFDAPHVWTLRLFERPDTVR